MWGVILTSPDLTSSLLSPFPTLAPLLIVLMILALSLVSLCVQDQLSETSRVSVDILLNHLTRYFHHSTAKHLSEQHIEVLRAKLVAAAAAFGMRGSRTHAHIYFVGVCI